MKYITLLILCFPLTAFADGSAAHCTRATPVQSDIWYTISDEATTARDAICDHVRLANQDTFEQARSSLTTLYAAIINQANLIVIKDEITAWLQTVDNNSTRHLHYADLTVVSGRGAQLNNFTTHSLHQTVDATILTLGADALARCNCEDDLRALDSLLGMVNYATSDAYIQNSKIQIEALNLAWASFLDDAREQTYWDIGITTWANRIIAGKSGVDFDRPPARQFFIARPNIVVDNLGAAADGDELQESLALEIIGVNWWQDNACFNSFACGVSVTVNYADRAGVEATGWGLMLHINNSYSIGMSKFSGDVGVFVSIDLLQLLKDKKSTYNNYIQSRVAAISQ